MAKQALRTVGTPTPAPADPHHVDVIADGAVPAGIEEVTGGPEAAGEIPVIGGDAPAPTLRALAVTAPPALPAPSRTMTFDPDSGIEGDWGADDVKFPTLKLVQGSGPLSQTYVQGVVILGEDEVLPSPDLKIPKPEHFFRFIPVSMKKQYRENLPDEAYKAGEMARVVDTLEEVEKLGGSTQWINDEKPSWGPTARVLLLIERPENLPGSGSDHPGFVLDLGGKLYAPAVYYAQGGSYTNFAKPLFNACSTMLMIPRLDAGGQPMKVNGVIQRRPYLPKSIWMWRTVRRPSGDYITYTPELRVTKEETSAEIREFLKTLAA